MTIAAGNKYPRAFFSVVFGSGKSSPLAAPKKLLCLGYKTSAGTTAVNTASPITSTDDAKAQFGGGSEIHHMAKAIFDEVADATVYGLAYEEAGGGTAAAKTITVTNASTLGGNLALYCNGERVDVTIDDAMSANNQAARINSTLNALTDLPFTCTVLNNVVTATWKHKGARSNQFALRYVVESITGSTYAIADTVAGATDSNPGTALDTIANDDYDIIITGANVNDANTGINRVLQYVNNRADPLVDLRGVVIAATLETYANAVTLATSQNAHRLFLMWCRSAEDTTWIIAAKAAAQIANGTSSDPTANLIGTEFKTFHGPFVSANKISQNEATQALNNGLTPIRFNRQNAAYMVRPITSRSQDVNGSPDYRTLDIGKVFMPDYFADKLDSDIPITFKGFKLKDDSADTTSAQPIDKVLTPKFFKGYLIGSMNEEEQLGRLKNVAANQSLVKVSVHPSVPSRLVADVPLDVIDLAAQFDVTLRQVG